MSGLSEPNPYVGPRSIQQGEPLYGRSEEVHALFCELQARRIVVLHSPSGAGKSSLVQAGLIPRLQEEKYDVWKPIRVNLDPVGLEGVPAGTNRYLLSAMLSLEEELPEGKRRSPAELAGMELTTYLQTRPRRKKQQGRPVVLLFDQFEEVLTVAPRALEAKRAFFTAVGQALADEHYWVLFIVREDFLAAFSPYRDRIPTHMANTLRLDLLGLAGAREAALRPALAGGRAFPAVDQLIRDLSTTQVQQADGSFVAEQGLYVEPVQLQVVCRRLWAAMPADDRSIDAEDIEQYASVSDSLAGYYAQVMADVANGDVAIERAVREWVGEQLVAGGIRSQVRQGVGKSGGLDNALIEGLLDSYLVRTEQRAGVNWFELSHDRLVEPVQQDNERWEEAHLHPLQVQAKLWENGKRAAELLLGADALLGAVDWAKDNEVLLTEGEREFLEQSRMLRFEQARQRRTQRIVTVVIGAVAILAISLGVLAGVKWFEAEEAVKEAKAKKEAAERARDQARDATWMAYIRTFKDKDPLRVLLGLRNVRANETLGWLQDAAEVLQQRQRVPQAFLAGHVGALSSARFSPDGEYVVTASEDRTARVWRADGLNSPIVLQGHEGTVLDARFSPDGQRVVTASKDGTVRVWRTDGSGSPVILQDIEGAALSAEFSPDGRRIVTASEDGTRVWNADGSGGLVVLGSRGQRASSAMFSPDGQFISTVSEDGTRVWRSDGSSSPVLLEDERCFGGSSATFSPDGQRIVTVSVFGGVCVWRTDGSGPLVLRDSGEMGGVRSASFSPDGLVVTVSDEGTVRVWNEAGVDLDLDLGSTLSPESRVSSASLSPDGQRIVAVSEEGTVRVMDVDGSGEPVVLEGYGWEAISARFSPDGQRIVAASRDGTAWVWKANGLGSPVILESNHESLNSAMFSPDGQRIVTASDDGSAWVWNADGSGEPVVLKGHGWEVHSAMFSPDGQRIVTASRDGTVRVWKADGSGSVMALKGHEFPVVSAMYSKDGQHIVSASLAGKARVWRADGSGGAPFDLGHQAPVNSVSFSLDGQHIVSASDDHTARVWRADGSGSPIVFEGHEREVFSAGFSPDGQYIVTASRDGTARVWRADGSGSPVVLVSPEGEVFSASFSPDGQRIVTGSRDGTARVWKADGSGLTFVLKGHEGDVKSANFSLDGQRIVTASEDGTTRVWEFDIDPASLRRQLEVMTTICVSVEDRVTYLGQTQADACKAFSACEQRYGRSSDCRPRRATRRYRDKEEGKWDPENELKRAPSLEDEDEYEYKGEYKKADPAWEDEDMEDVRGDLKAEPAWEYEDMEDVKGEPK